MCRKLIYLISFILVLSIGFPAKADLVITNGDFEVGAGAGSVDQVDDWYDNDGGGFWTDAWQTDASSITPNGTQVVVFSGEDVVEGDLLAGSYLYQSIGTSSGESSIKIAFDWGHPDDVPEGRAEGLTVSVLASDGSFVADDANDVLGAAGITLLDYASYDHVALGTDGEIFPVEVTLDLSGANAGDEIILRFNNYWVDSTQSWPVLDNVQITEVTPAPKIIYVDATEGEAGNTILATGDVFTSTGDGSGSDNLWRGRVFGNEGTIFESGGQYGDTANPENCSRLMTTIDVPEGRYEVYAYFWDDGSGWRIQASLTDSEGDLPLFIANDPNGGATLAVAEDFEEPVPMLSEDNRTLWQAYLGTTGITTMIDVFIDDDPNHQTHNGRTWYDGIGYKVIPPLANIIWVSDNLKYDFDVGVPSDQGFIDLLKAEGYLVNYKGQYDPHEPGNDEVPVNPEWTYWRELNDDKIAELEAADLIIIGRVNNSGSFDDSNEAEMWNAISTPLISQSAHISRQYSKWGWFATGSTTNKTPRLMQVTAPDHDIFAGVEIDSDSNIDLVVQDAQVTLVKLNEGVVEGNGTLLGVHDEGYPWIVEWDAGVEYYEGSGQIAGGPRMFLGSAVGATNEAAGLIEGGYNLTADGETVFLNAVKYMLSAAPVAPVH